MAARMARTTSGRLPSEKLGTHSIRVSGMAGDQRLLIGDAG
jgi:hypothetical protein